MSRPNRYLILLFVGATLGLLFASVSTRDFAMHLDREVHDVTCSFTPGISGPEAGESGCLVTMISPYSSVLRTWVWGGVPIALPAMAVFAFLLAFGVELVLSGRQHGRRATSFLALATALPAAASLVMAGISILEVEAVCKLCVGIYVASALCLAGGVGAWFEARRGPGGVPIARAPSPPAAGDDGAEPAFLGGHAAAEIAPEPEPEPAPPRAARPARDAEPRSLAVAFAVGVVFVMAPVVIYGAVAPDHSGLIGSCGALDDTEDAGDVMLSIGGGDVPAVEILDPLCPACAQFEARLEQSGYGAELARKAVLFPLDDQCNWMIDEAIHPGACSISEAVLCAEDRAAEVLDWSFDNQEQILAAEKQEIGAAAKMVSSAFPELGSCIGSAKVKARLNRSLRWAVENEIQVVTPQLYVGGVKLCEEDVDLGLAFTLSRMIERHRAGTLRAQGEPEPETEDSATVPDEAAVEPEPADGDGETAPAAADEVPAAADEATEPADEKASSVDETPAPADEKESSVDEAPAAADDKATPVDDTPAPADDTPAPSDEAEDPGATDDPDAELVVPDPGDDDPMPPAAPDEPAADTEPSGDQPTEDSP